MNEPTVVTQLRAIAGEATDVTVVSEHVWHIDTPFIYDDGDHLTLELRLDEQGWLLSDYGHLFVQLEYDLLPEDLDQVEPRQFIDGVLDAYRMVQEEHELRRYIGLDDLALAWADMIQAMLRIYDVRFLIDRRERTTFRPELDRLLTDAVGEDALVRDWTHRRFDPEGLYPADYRMTLGEQAVVLFALDSAAAAGVANVALLKYEDWGLKHHVIGIYDNQQSLPSAVVARLTNVIDKQLSSFVPENQQRLRDHLAKLTTHQAVSTD